MRRARVPIAYSSGYSPHPRISYAGAAPTGSASEAEYLEVALTRRCQPDRVRVDLDAALPDGLDIVAVLEVGADRLGELEASHWTVLLPGVEPDELADAVRRFLAAETVQVERMTKRGLRHFDARAAVVSLTAEAPVESPAVSPAESPVPSTGASPTEAVIATPDSGDDPERWSGCAILQLVVRHGTPSVRPDDVLAGLREVAGLSAPSPPVQRRMSQGPLDLVSGTVSDPFVLDRDTLQE